MNLVEEDQKYILNVYRRMNLEIVKGEGCYLIDANGTRYLDLFSGIAVNSLGQNNEAIKAAITEQMNQYLHLSNYFVSPQVVQLAKLLVENSFASKVFFSNSGTEAIEAAIKIARKYGKKLSDKKTELVALTNSFHGRTYGGLSLTGQDKYKKSFTPVVPDVKHVVFNDCNSLIATVSENTCAIFLEIIQGEGGVVPLTQPFVDEVVRLSKKYDFLIVVDEIQTGLGRTGEFFAYLPYHFTPDLVTVAKSLGGGIPIGALLVNEKCESIFDLGEHGSTFGGNPLAASVGSVVIKTILSTGFLQDVKDKGIFLKSQLEVLKSHYPTIIHDIRGEGLMIGIDVGERANTIKIKGLEHQLLLNVTSQTVIRLLPPLTISYEEITSFIDRFKDICEETSQNDEDMKRESRN